MSKQPLVQLLQSCNMSSIDVSRHVLRRVLIVGVRELREQMLKRKKRQCRWFWTSLLAGNITSGQLPEAAATQPSVTAACLWHSPAAGSGPVCLLATLPAAS
ncbi:hypothetical protein J6590_086739 [Homalodisca vitripennis]|nr:hypothetical protein J6590_086739 [Homalodisca vitripennis]